MYPAFLFRISKSSTSVLLVFIFFCLFSSCLTCPTSLNFDKSLCQFNLQYLDSNCSSFTFTNCTISCQQGTKGCWKESIGWTEWGNCLSYCCHFYSDSDYLLNNGTLKECQAQIYYRKKMDTIRFVLFIALLSTGFLMLGLSLSLNRCRKRNNQPNNRDNLHPDLYNIINNRPPSPPLNQQPPPPPSQRPSSPLNQRPESDNLFVVHSWVHSNSPFGKTDELCAVCRTDRVTVYLKCGHLFHTGCMIQSMSKELQCIICKMQDFNPIRVYCDRCLCSYLEWVIEGSTLASAGQHLICDQCMPMAGGRDKENDQ